MVYTFYIYYIKYNRLVVARLDKRNAFHVSSKIIIEAPSPNKNTKVGH